MEESIKYYMTPIQFEAYKDYYRAVVLPDGTFTIDNMVEEISKRNLGVPTNLIKPFIELIFKVRDEQLASNRNVYLGDTFYSLSAPGRFETAADTPDFAKVNVSLKGESSKLSNPSWERITERIDTSVPVLRDFEDGATGETNSIITANNIAKLTGVRLDFDKTDESQGVFYINDDTKEPTRVDVYSEVRPSQLIFLTPSLANGNYTVQVRSKASETADLKTGMLQVTLSVSSQLQ